MNPNGNVITSIHVVEDKETYSYGLVPDNYFPKVQFRLYRVDAFLPCPLRGGEVFVLAQSAKDAESQAECAYGWSSYSEYRDKHPLLGQTWVKTELIPLYIRGWSAVQF